MVTGCHNRDCRPKTNLLLLVGDWLGFCALYAADWNLQGATSVESHPLLPGESKIVPPLVITDETRHARDRLGSSPRRSPPRSPATAYSSGGAPFATPRRIGSSSSLMPEGSRVAEAPLPSPRKEGALLKRSLTMSAGAVNVAPLLSQMNTKFIKSILDLPVASDIPRMVSRTTVTSIAKGEDGEAAGLIFNRSEGTLGQPKPENAIALSKSFITLLFQAYNADNKRLLTLANEKFDEILPIDFEGDTRDRFNEYLEAIVMSELTVSAILKCINQGIAAPAIMALRMGLMGKLNYKDCGNNWNIEVQTNTNSAIVTHEKREMTVPAGCEFVWRLEMHLAAPFSQLMHVEFSITEVHFTDDNMDMERKVKIIEALSAFFSNDLRDKYSTLSPSKIGLRPPNSARAEGPSSPTNTTNGSLAPPQLTIVSAPVLEIPSSSAASSSASKRLAPKDAR